MKKLIWIITILYCSFAQASPIIEASKTEDIQAGRFAFMDILNNRIIEYDISGNLTWEFKLPWTMSTRFIQGGADVEWLPDTDSFLFVLPKAGVYEVNRDKKIVWRYETTAISHDADRLPNGNVIFLNGWDTENEPTFTEVNRGGDVIQQWFASKNLDPSLDKKNAQVISEPYTYTHANAINRLADGSTLVSLRNFNMYVIVRDGVIMERKGDIHNLHDPVLLGDKLCFAARNPNRVECRSNGVQNLRFAPNDKLWQPMRTVEPLKNGNLLITGSALIGQLSPKGDLVWSVKFTEFGFQNDGKPFIFKATWVYK